MSDYGDLRIGTSDLDGTGLVANRHSPIVDANTTRKITTTLGLNLDSSNDFTIPVQMSNGRTIYLRPDTVEDLKKLVENRLSHIASAEATTMDGISREAFKIAVFQGDRPIGDIDSYALLDAISHQE